jgi:ATP-binding cassette subfamily F protein 3
VISVRGLSKSYGDAKVFSNVNFTVTRGEKIALVGMNGAGKSTLSRLLSSVEAPSAGDIRYGLNVKLSFFSQESAENLNYSSTILEDINSTPTRCNDQEKRNLLGTFLFSGDDIYKPVAVLSGGEKSRLALLKILLQDANLLILDEPTNHLDMKTRDIFQQALLDYNGTIILVSHDRYFLDRLISRVIEIRNGQTIEYKGNYSYFIAKREEELNNAVALPPTKTFGSADQDVESKHVRKEMRRLEAEERNRRSKMRTALKRNLSTIEQTIMTLEGNKKEIEEILCTPDIYRNPEKLKMFRQELHAIDKKLERSYIEWDDLTLQSEALDNTTGEGTAPFSGGGHNSSNAVQP